MSEQLFTVEAGYRIETETGEFVDIIPVSGIPGGDAGEQDAAGPGSIALDYTNGTKYTKTASGAGTDKWTEEATKAYVDATAGGLSWREPALAKDDSVYANLTAAEVAVNTGAIDGVTVVDESRVLFTAIAGENDNVYIVTGTPGAGATLVEDTNLATDGDALFIQDGTSADQQYSYTGTSWAQIGGTTSSELGFLRAFMGKDAGGSELPSYSTTNIVANNDTLETAIGKLDTAVQANADAHTGINTSIGNLQTEIDNVEAAMGAAVNTDGTFNLTALDGGDYMDSATDVTGALLALDAQIATNATNIGTNATNISNLQTEINDTQTGAGLGTSGAYTADGGANYIDTATDLFNADQLLDAQVKLNADAIAGFTNPDTEDAFIRSYIGKSAAGAENPTYTSTDSVTQSGTLEEAIGELDAAIGADVSNGTVILAANDVQQNIAALDAGLAAAGATAIVDAASAATFVTVDTVDTGVTLMARWLVHIQLGVNVTTWEVTASHNKDGATAATVVDFTKYAKLKMGNIPAVNVQVILSGTDMLLQVKDTAGTAVVNALRTEMFGS